MVEAAHGQAALSQIAVTAFDLMLLDLHLPQMDGVELIAALRESEAGRGIPIIVITAQDVRPEERVQLDRSVARMLQKGTFRTADLLREIRAAARRDGSYTRSASLKMTRTASRCLCAGSNWMVILALTVYLLSNEREHRITLEYTDDEPKPIDFSRLGTRSPSG